jgi:hypothetical protein
LGRLRNSLTTLAKATTKGGHQAQANEAHHE